MSDSTSLRDLLRSIDISAEAIQRTAGAMMRFYQSSTDVAVSEWRNALNVARDDQLLPLLYVANEVLQNSKRNRGNRFLEAFSPILGQSLAHICQQLPDGVEKVRRTVKIWGDRRVFSIRYVNELLNGLEPFRHGAVRPPPPAAAPRAPPAEPEAQSNSDDDDSDILKLLDKDDADKNDAEESSSDDESDLFAPGSQGPKLVLDINLEAATASTPSPSSHKRRRSSTASASSTHKRRKSVLSSNNLLDVWARLTTLESDFGGAQRSLTKIDNAIAKMPAEELEHLVGDELHAAYRSTVRAQQEIIDQRKALHAIAEERHFLEQEAIRYLPWLEAALKQDDDDLEFCDRLQAKLESFKPLHAIVRAARDVRIAEERKRQQEAEERERKRREEEENERFRQAALAKETEAKPGMVWNPTTREYQSLNTDESWRD